MQEKHAMKLVTLAIVMVLFAAQFAAAGDYEDGIEAYDAADYSTAFAYFKKAADEGNSDAQALVGYMYANGQGVPIDLVSAYVWYELSAKRGNQNAAYNLKAIGSKLTPDQITVARQRAKSLKKAQ
ncbi:MAG: tetratricopeptide repeat protein [Rhizobiaceae bacterium]